MADNCITLECPLLNVFFRRAQKAPVEKPSQFRLDKSQWPEIKIVVELFYTCPPTFHWSFRQIEDQSFLKVWAQGV